MRPPSVSISYSFKRIADFLVAKGSSSFYVTLGPKAGWPATELFRMGGISDRSLGLSGSEAFPSHGTEGPCKRGGRRC